MSSPRKVKAIVTNLQKYRDNITLFRFKTGFQIKFKPGQFLHLALDNYDPSFIWPESRAFSIANAPGKEFIDILVSPKGKFTNRMITEVSVGKQIWLKLPYGIFNFNASAGKDVVLVAGGTGISPFISFLDSILGVQANYNSVSLFYGVRHPDLIIFGNNINIYKQKINKFHYRIFCENFASTSSSQFEPGVLPVEEIINQTSLYPDPVYYLSGPKAMIESFEKKLTDKGIPSDRILFDRWE
jgi:ferredoxin-NADP reductase